MLIIPEMVTPTMRAVRYSIKGPPSVLEVDTIPTPKPGPGEVLVKVEFAAVNPVDAHVRSAEHPQLRVPLPATPGKDASGYIVDIGPDVQSYIIGDRVAVCDQIIRPEGTYAEYHVAKAEEVFKLPQNYSNEEGASIGAPYFTAIRAIFHAAKGKAGETLFIHGASGQVGVACVQVGVAHGFIVYGTAGTEEGSKRVLDCGAKAVFNHRDGKYLEKVKEDIGPKGPDIIIEMIASTNLQKDLELASRRGRIVVVGGRGMLSINPALILAKEVIVTGVKLVDTTPEEWTEMRAVFENGVAKGWIRPTVGKIYALTEVVQAHHDVENPSSSQGRLLLKL